MKRRCWFFLKSNIVEIVFTIVVVLAAIAIIFIIVMIFTPQIAERLFPRLRESVTAVSTGAMVFATLLLAYVTYRIIKSDRQRESRDRKERLLNEIIEWAIDVSQCEFMADVSDLREIVSKYIGTKQEGDIRQKDANFKKDLKAAMIVDMGNVLIRYRAFTVRNLYIVDVADTFGGDLKKATDLLCIHVQAHTRLLEKLQDQYDELHEERVSKHSPYLEQYALNVTKEAVKLKRKDIN